MTTSTTRDRLQEALDVLFSHSGQRYGKATITGLARIAGVVPKTVYTYPDIVEEFKRRLAKPRTGGGVDWEAECKRRSTEFVRDRQLLKQQIRQTERERDSAYQRIQILELRLIQAEEDRLVAITKMNTALGVPSIS